MTTDWNKVMSYQARGIDPITAFNRAEHEQHGVNAIDYMTKLTGILIRNGFRMEMFDSFRTATRTRIIDNDGNQFMMSINREHMNAFVINIMNDKDDNILTIHSNIYDSMRSAETIMNALNNQ